MCVVVSHLMRVYVCVYLQAEHELIAIMPHFHLRDNSGILNFISVK